MLKEQTAAIWADSSRARAKFGSSSDVGLLSTGVTALAATRSGRAGNRGTAKPWPLVPSPVLRVQGMREICP